MINSILGNFLLLTSISCCLLIIYTDSVILTQAGIHTIRTITLEKIKLISAILAPVCLLNAFLSEDFSLLNIYQNSHSLQPLRYKIGALWGSHEGSMLLWNLLMISLSLFSYQIKGSRIFTNSLTLLFLIFTLFYANPFTLILGVTPTEGVGFNPILQDNSLMIHPPILYLGYVCTIYLGVFSLNLSENSLKFIKTFLTFSWTILTLGITLGASWAYRELGWGGYWFWDPVENVSFLPWLLLTATMHLIYLSKISNPAARQKLLKIVSLINFFAATLVLLGLFAVRGGLLVSVHGFTNNNKAYFLLIIVIFFILAWLYQNKKIETHNPSHNTSSKKLEKSFLSLTAALFLILAISVAIGTFFPIFSRLITNSDISLGIGYFNRISLFVFLALGINMLIFLFKLNLATKLLKPLSIAFINMLTFAVISYCTAKFVHNNFLNFIVIDTTSFWTLSRMILPLFILISLNLLSILGYLLITKKSDLLYKTHISIVHFLLSITIISIISSSIFSIEKDLLFDKIGPKNTAEINGLKFQYLDTSYALQQNFAEKQFNFVISNQNKTLYLTPSTRFYPIENQLTVEDDISSNWLYDIHIVPDIRENEKISVRVYIKPMVKILWLSIWLLCGWILIFLTMRKFN